MPTRCARPSASIVKASYLESARSFLTPLELQLLPFSVGLFPMMQAVRFLTDYLNGDTYYKTAYPLHNLVRTRNQLQLFRRIKERFFPE
jgi:hypothetical protein